MNDTDVLGLIALALPAVAGLFCLMAALALLGLVRANKGAKLNRAWGLIAFGLACLALAAVDRTLERLGFSNTAQFYDALSALASVFIMAGAIYGRRIYKDLLK